MARECGWCGHPQRDEWERLVTQGENVSRIATRTPFSVAAAYRHIRMHMSPSLLGAIKAPGATLRLAEYATRLHELAESAASVRAFAVATQNPRLILQAIKVEQDVLVASMQRLGVESTDMPEHAAEAEAFVGAVVRVLVSEDFPGLPEAFADQLEREGLADEFVQKVRSASPAPSINERS